MTDDVSLSDQLTSAPPSDGHVIFVGLPGSGKSTIGRTVAKLLGRPFLDFDREIEQRAGKTVARIFAEEGEAAFRASAGAHVATW